jgi:N-acetylmuramoyl-L-alanine amidase
MKRLSVSLPVVRVPSQSEFLKIVLFFLGLNCQLSSFSKSDTVDVCRKEVIFSARTQGQIPFLKYGPGTDRLGGAKMTYLDTSVVLQVVDSLNDDYIVRLSQNHKAFIPKENVIFDPDIRRPDYYLTSSWKVYGDEKCDYVSINLDERLPYKSIELIDPSRIVIDIYGATGNTNWLTQLKSAREIKNVYHEQVEDDVFRVTIELMHSQHWGYSIRYNNKTLIVCIKRQPDRMAINHLKIAIDAGHGGSNSGAKGLKSNVEEKIFNLLIAKELEKYLKRRGAEVFMTRIGDDDLNMTDRILTLRGMNPDLLICIHHNAASNPKVQGVSTYYRYDGSKPLTLAILDRLLELGLAEFGNIGSFNFSLNGPTEYPNCLVEVAFLSNEEDEKRIVDPIFQRNVAKKIRKGITDWIHSAR